MKHPFDFVAVIIMLAILAVLIAPGSKTTDLLQAIFSLLNRLLSVIVSPISSGASAAPSATGGASLFGGNPFANGGGYGGEEIPPLTIRR